MNISLSLNGNRILYNRDGKIQFKLYNSKPCVNRFKRFLLKYIYTWAMVPNNSDKSKNEVVE